MFGINKKALDQQKEKEAFLAYQPSYFLNQNNIYKEKTKAELRTSFIFVLEKLEVTCSNCEPNIP